VSKQTEDNTVLFSLWDMIGAFTTVLAFRTVQYKFTFLLTYLFAYLYTVAIKETCSSIFDCNSS